MAQLIKNMTGIMDNGTYHERQVKIPYNGGSILVEQLTVANRNAINDITVIFGEVQGTKRINGRQVTEVKPFEHCPPDLTDVVRQYDFRGKVGYMRPDSFMYTDCN